ncbi:MAG: DUF1566 domain-containing protein [Rhodocyclaceae bacterium]|nr:DUF1566 domain-containing protein [Rhodocyclaceae bacterium]
MTPHIARSPTKTCAVLLFSLIPLLVQAEVTTYVALNAKGKKTLPQTGLRAHPCVLDTASGLVWEVKTDDNGPRDKKWTYSWHDKTLEKQRLPVGYLDGGQCMPKGRCDTESYMADINKRGLCGFRDWRLPTVEELESLLRPDAQGAKIDARFFPNTLASYFWTSRYVYSEVGGAMLVSFDLALSLEGNSASGTSVRLVRGQPNHPMSSVKNIMK